LGKLAICVRITGLSVQGKLDQLITTLDIADALVSFLVRVTELINKFASKFIEDFIGKDQLIKSSFSRKKALVWSTAPKKC
jgi:hypothetical protein